MISLLPAGMPVFSENGYKPVEDIKVGNLILDHNGYWQPVTEIEKNEYKGKLIGISCVGSTKKTFMTPDFQMPIFESVSLTNGIEKALSGKNITATNAETVRQNQFTLLPRLTLPGTLAIDVGDYFGQYRTVLDGDVKLLRNWAGHKMPRFIKLNLEFGKIIGYMVACKTVRDKNLCEVTFNKTDEAFATEYAELLERVFNIKSQTVRRNGITVRFTSSIICQFLNKFFGGNYFPHVIWSSNEEFIRGVLVAIINGRGIYNTTDINYFNTARRLLMDVKMLFLAIGILVTIKKSARKHYIIQITGDNLSFVYQMCGKNRTARFDKLYARKHRNSQFMHLYQKWSIARITKVVGLDYHGQVYSLGTAKNSFTTAFAAYNRVPQ